jgi:hypothetical protein
MSLHHQDELLPVWLQAIRKAIDDQKVTHESLVPVLEVTTRGAVGHYLNNRRELSVKQLIALTQRLNLDIREVTGLTIGLKELGPSHALPESEQLSRIYHDLSKVEHDFALRRGQSDGCSDVVSHLLTAKLALNSALKLLTE